MEFAENRKHSRIAMMMQSRLLSHGSGRVLKTYQRKSELLDATAEQVRELQRQRLAELLLHAKQNVPLYRERFQDASFQHSGDVTLDTLRSLPTLTREDLQNHSEYLRAFGWKSDRLIRNSSGGSSGTPVMVWQDQAYRDELLASAWISDSMQGWRFGDRVAMLWGSPKDLKLVRSIKSRLLTRARRVRFYDAFAMGPDRMEQFHRELQGYRPHVLIGYASALALFARHLLDAGYRPKYPLASIISSAECLSERKRRLIETCFQVPVFNRYGSREVGCIASECSERNGLHLHPLDNVVEVVDPTTKEPLVGRPGKVLITALTNFAMPLIRYELGDIAVLSERQCGCGFPGQLLETVVGRTSDFIQAPTGRQIHGEYFTHAFYGLNTVRQFQFVQKSKTDYLLRLVITPEFDGADLDRILAETEHALGTEAKIAIEFPNSIPPMPSGKQCFTMSEIQECRP